MTAVKLTKSQMKDLVDGFRTNTPVDLKLSSRMLADPDEGIDGVVKLPLSKRQIEKLNKSIRATPYTISKTNMKKLSSLNKEGSGFFDVLKSVVSVPVKAGVAVGKAVGKKALDVGEKVLDKAIEEAIVAAPLLLAGAGTASIKASKAGTKGIKGIHKEGMGGSGGVKGTGKVVKMNNPPPSQKKTNVFVSST